MWRQFIMNTSEAALSIIFIAIFIIEHGNRAMGTQSPDKATTNCTKPTKKPFRVTGSTPVLQGKNLVLQDPRFIGVRRGQNISITCGCQSSLPKNSTITWYREEQEKFKEYVLANEHITMEDNILHITRVQKRHSGIYFCNFTFALNRALCGTELIVLGTRTEASTKSRNIMKDAIIIVQTILIVLFTSVPVLLLKEMKKKRTLKIEDHTYEGLEAYQTATYEDIQTVRVLASKAMEGEHPCLE